MSFPGEPSEQQHTIRGMLDFTTVVRTQRKGEIVIYWVFGKAQNSSNDKH